MEQETFGMLSIVPPLLAIGMAIATRQIILSLLGGVWVGWVIHAGGNPLAGTAEAVTALVDVFVDPGQTRIIIFTMLMGSLLILMKRGGGIDGFLGWVSQWTWSQTRRGAQLMASFIGLGVFIDRQLSVGASRSSSFCWSRRVRNPRARALMSPKNAAMTYIFSRLSWISMASAVFRR